MVLPWNGSSIGKSCCLLCTWDKSVCVVFGHLGLCVKECEVKEISVSAALAACGLDCLPEMGSEWCLFD